KANLIKKGFGYRGNDPSNPNSLSSNKVTSIIEDTEGIVWIGTDGGGLNRWDRITNRFTSFKADSSDPTALKSNSVGAVLDDSHEQLWVSNGNVLSQLNRKTGKFTHYSRYYESLNRIGPFQIFAIAEDKQGLLWFNADGIRRFNEKTGEVK